MSVFKKFRAVFERRVPEMISPLSSVAEGSTVPIEVCATFRQGDVVKVDYLPIEGLDGTRQYSTPHGAVLLSQTCDAIRPDKRTVILAPIALVEDNEAGLAKSERILRYVSIPALAAGAFADMYFVATVDKNWFATLDREPGVDADDDDQVRNFGRAIGRRFSRFPFPNDVVYWLQPLENVVLRKHDKDSPEGAALRDVLEFRIESAGGWSSSPVSLTLCTIVKPSVIPSFESDEPPLCPQDLEQFLWDDNGKLYRTSAQIAVRLASERASAPSSASAYWLWLALANSWAEMCQPDYEKLVKKKYITNDEIPRVRNAVTSIDADVVDERGFNLYRYRRSELLDVDHLSPPTPL
jgi:hypothetical protein